MSVAKTDNIWRSDFSELPFEESSNNGTNFFSNNNPDEAVSSDSNIITPKPSKSSSSLNTKQSKPSKSPQKGKFSSGLLWVIIAILIIGLIAGLVFFQKQRSKLADLRRVQHSLEQEIASNEAKNSQALKDLAKKLALLRSNYDDDLPKDLESQYQSLLAKISTMANSSDSQTSVLGQQLLKELTNQPGSGIGLSGSNNTTINNEGVLSVNGQNGAISIQGTPNQTTVTQGGGVTTVGTAQDIAQTSSPTFNNQTLTGSSSVGGGLTVQGNTKTDSLTIQNSGTQNGYALCDSSNNCGYSGAGASFVQGGNSFGNPANIGTNDNNDLNLETNGVTRLNLDTAGNANFTGNVGATGSVTANTLNGNGAGVTNVDATKLGGQSGSYYQNASNVNTGTLADGRLSGNVTLQGNTFNGANQLVQLNSGGILPILDGSQLTNVVAANSTQLGGQGAAYYLNASNLNSGTLSDTLLSGNVTLQGNTFNGPNQLVKLGSGGLLPVLNGSNLTNIDAVTLNGQLASYYLNGSNINAGTLADARLSANVALKNATNTFTGTNNFAGLTATGILQNGYSVCDGSNNCNYATSGQFANAILQGGNSFGSTMSIGTNDNQSFAIRTNGADQLTVLANGNIGVGTNTPGERLQVEGNLKVSGINQPFIEINSLVEDGTTNSWAGIAFGGAGLDRFSLYKSNSSKLIIRSGNRITGSNLITFLSTGNVGIGYNTPAEKLQVAGNGLFSGSITGASLFQGANQVCDTSNNCSYAANTGSANYIQSGTAVQTADMNISGNGTFGSRVYSQRGFNAISSGLAGAAYNIGWNGNVTAYWLSDPVNESGNAIFTPSSGRTIFFKSAAINNTALTVKAFPSQVADLQQWQDSSGAVLASIGASGHLTLSQSNAQVKIGTSQKGYIGLGAQGDYSGNYINKAAMCMDTTCLQGDGGGTLRVTNHTGLITSGRTMSNFIGANNVGSLYNGVTALQINEVLSNTKAHIGFNSATSSGVAALFGTSSINNVSMGIKTLAGQTADNLQVQDTNGGVLTRILNNGALSIGGSTGGNALLTLRSSSTPTGVPTEGAASIRLNRTADDGGSTNSTGAIEFGNSSVKTWRSGNTLKISSYSGVSIDNNSGDATSAVASLQGRTGQTGDLLQAQNSAGIVLAKIDASGNLTVKNADIQGAYISFSNNIRGYNVAVAASASTQTVTFPTAHPDANYAVFCTPNWNTTCFVSGKTTTGFTLNYGTPTPSLQTVDWFVAH